MSGFWRVASANGRFPAQGALGPQKPLAGATAIAILTATGCPRNRAPYVKRTPHPAGQDIPTCLLPGIFPQTAGILGNSARDSADWRDIFARRLRNRGNRPWVITSSQEKTEGKTPCFALQFFVPLLPLHSREASQPAAMIRWNRAFTAAPSALAPRSPLTQIRSRGLPLAPGRTISTASATPRAADALPGTARPPLTDAVSGLSGGGVCFCRIPQKDVPCSRKS